MRIEVDKLKKGDECLLRNKTTTTVKSVFPEKLTYLIQTENDSYTINGLYFDDTETDFDIIAILSGNARHLVPLPDYVNEPPSDCAFVGRAPFPEAEKPSKNIFRFVRGNWQNLQFGNARHEEYAIKINSKEYWEFVNRDEQEVKPDKVALALEKEYKRLNLSVKDFPFQSMDAGQNWFAYQNKPVLVDTVWLSVSKPYGFTPLEGMPKSLISDYKDSLYQWVD